MKLLKNIGIRTRMLASLLSVLFLCIGLTGYFLLHDAEKQISDFRQTHVLYQAKTLAEGSLDGLVSADYSLLERWVASSLPSKDYAYACLVALDGRILSHTDMSMIGKSLSTPNNLAQAIVRNAGYKGRPVKEAIYPATIGNKHLANAHVAYYLDIQYKSETSTTIRLILVLLVGTILLIIGIYVIINIIFNPIKRLTSTVSTYSLDSNIVIDKDIIERSDEIGVLSATFNNLLNKLSLSYKELEERVIERTKELQSANDELQKNESRVKSIVENVADAVVCINARGIIQSYNNSAMKLFGYPTETAIGSAVSILMPEPFSNNHDTYINKYLETGLTKKLYSQSRELCGKTSDGHVFPMEISVTDVVTKDQHLFVAVMRDITERKKQLDDLHYYANHDVLTGLYNRKFFMTELAHAVEIARRLPVANCALLYIDLDKFKFINDTMGHAAGDQVLCDVTKIMKDRTRKSDVLARLGGDEFAIIVYNTSIDDVDQIANSFRAKLDKYEYIQDGVVANVGCSIGVAMVHPEYTTAKEVLADADAACYSAKRNGRNQVAISKKASSAR